jgi:hypothetical protein
VPFRHFGGATAPREAEGFSFCPPRLFGGKELEMRPFLSAIVQSTVASFSLAAAGAVGLLPAAPARAATFASDVMHYEPGNAVRQDGYLSQFVNGSAVLGAPEPITGERENGFPNVLNPFSSAYESDEFALVGEGGELTIALPRYAVPGAGLELGVISNAALQDSSWFGGGAPGTNYASALGFGGGAATVSVSADGQNFVSLGRIVFNAPSNYYRNAGGPYDSAAPADPQLADFGVPFEKNLSDFDGKNFAATLAEFGASGGGTWLDLSSRGLKQVGYVRFTVADETRDIDRLGIDAIVIANGAVGGVVPEPGTAAASGVAAALALLRRRRTPRRRVR